MIDDLQIDMLVDGELSEHERCDLLARLDSEPDGWRRCALAFLESQTWRTELQSISRKTIAEPAIAPKPRPAWSRLRALTAMAACFLVALGLGFALDHLTSRPGPAPVRLTTHVTRTETTETPEKTETADHEQPPATPQPTPAPSNTESQIPYRFVTLPAQDPVSGTTESIQMPVVPQEYLGADWPYRLPSAVPDQFLQTLRQHGHDVVQQRRLVPFQAADGSSVVFPVDEVEILPVANRGYQ